MLTITVHLTQQDILNFAKKLIVEKNGASQEVVDKARTEIILENEYNDGPDNHVTETNHLIVKLVIEE